VVTANVSAAGKKIPVFVSPVVVRAGSDSVPAANVETPVTPSVVPTVSAPVMVAEARVADGEQARMLLIEMRLVVPDAAMVVSETSTTGNMSVAGSAVVRAVRAVILVSGMGQLD
jgi:hypothetical protein